MPIQIGLGISSEKDPLLAARDAVRLARANLLTQKFSLALVFSTVDFAHPTVLKTVHGLLGETPILGCSSFGILSNQRIFRSGLAVMLLSLPQDVCLNTACVRQISAKQALVSGEELGEKLLLGFKSVRRALGVIFSDGLMRDSTGLLAGIQEKLGISFPLAGACASDNLAFKKTFLYANGEVLNDAACGMLWGGKLNYGLGIRHGWKPLGKPRTVTRASGNTAYTIDMRPAAQIYQEYLGMDLARLRKELKRISILYPVGVNFAEGEYFLRNILSIEDNGALVFQGNIPAGAAIRMMIGTKESCLNATRQAMEEAKRGLGGAHCNFVLVFDSVSRHIILGRQAGRELEILREGFGRDTPLIGIYTYGEEAPLRAINYQGKAYFHNQSIAVLGIGG